MSGFLVDFRIAIRSLFQHGRRTFFLGLALAGVTGLLIVLSGLLNGVRDTMLNTATTLSTGHINVGGFYKVTSGQGVPVVSDFEKPLEVVKREVPEAAFTVQRGRGWAKIISDRGSMQAGLGGIDIQNEPEFKKVVQLSSGNIDDLAQPNTILVFESQLQKLDVKVGDAITISAQTTRGANNTIDCRVVAIAKDIGLLSKFNVYMPIQSLRDLYQLKSNATGALHVYLQEKHFEQIPQIAARLRTKLTEAGHRVMEPNPQPFWMKFQSVAREDWTGQKLDVTTWEDELSFITWTLKILQGLTTVLMLILIAIVVTGVMNTMWIAIRERTREIGTLRAIGMHRGSVARMFLMESLLLGLMGTVIGAVMGAGVALLVNALKIQVPPGVQLFLMSEHLHFSVKGAALVNAVVMLTVVTGLAALWPALRAARLRPVTAMSHFG